jgi:hypothetical protein
VELGFDEAAEAARAYEVLAAAGVGAPELDTTSVRMTAEDGAHVLVDALRTLDGGRAGPARVTVREPSLDDVFLALTGRHAEPEEAQ